MKDNTATRRLYVELMAHLVDREIAKFRRGEQAALVSFTNVAKLARNASKELTAPGARAHEPAMPALPPSCITAASKRATDERSVAHGQAPRL
jgi:hypothetical protein